VRCVRHPDVETNLTCGKCGDPICPKCMVQTPVGARCPKCANLRKLPVFEVPATYYLRAVAAGLVSAGALGAVWAFIPFAGFFVLIIGAALGFAVGEAISYSVNRKRGRGLQVIAGVSVLVAFIVRGILEYGVDFQAMFTSVYGVIALAIGLVVAVSRFYR